jgi:hypothetical protein
MSTVWSWASGTHVVHTNVIALLSFLGTFIREVVRDDLKSFGRLFRRISVRRHKDGQEEARYPRRKVKFHRFVWFTLQDWPGSYLVVA